MKILLAIDESKFSEAVIEAVIRQAIPQVTEVRVLHVIEPIPIYPDGQAWGYGPEASQVLDEQRKEAEGLVARAGQTLREKNFIVMTAIEEGNPKEVIIDSAAEWHADLIVVGRTDGRAWTASSWEACRRRLHGTHVAPCRSSESQAI